MENVQIKEKNNWVAIGFTFLFMVLAAIAENTKGVFIPTFAKEFKVSDGTISSIFIIALATYMIASFCGGALCEKLGQKKVFMLGITVIILSLFFLSQANSFIMLFIGTGAVGLGTGLGAISCNTVLPIIAITAQAVLMNVMHFCYGFGSSIGQKLFTMLTENGIGWRDIYFGTAIVFIVFLVIFTLFVKLPVVKGEHEEGSTKLSLGKILSNKLVICYALVLGFYAFAEIGTANWFVRYMDQTYNKGTECGSFYLPLFFGIFAIGRLFGGIIVAKRGYFNVLIKSLLLGAILYLVGIIIGLNGMILISISGLFFSITYPTVVLTISKVITKQTSQITGVIVSGSTCLIMILNYAVGQLSNMIGIQKAFYLLPISAILSVVIMVYLHNATKHVLVEKK